MKQLIKKTRVEVEVSRLRRNPYELFGKIPKIIKGFDFKNRDGILKTLKYIDSNYKDLKIAEKYSSSREEYPFYSGLNRKKTTYPYRAELGLSLEENTFEGFSNSVSEFAGATFGEAIAYLKYWSKQGDFFEIFEKMTIPFKRQASREKEETETIICIEGAPFYFCGHCYHYFAISYNWKSKSIALCKIHDGWRMLRPGILFRLENFSLPY